VLVPIGVSVRVSVPVSANGAVGVSVLVGLGVRVSVTCSISVGVSVTVSSACQFDWDRSLASDRLLLAGRAIFCTENDWCCALATLNLVINAPFTATTKPKNNTNIANLMSLCMTHLT
jgi:hypothetical protein